MGAISRSRWQTDEKALGVADRRTRRCGPLVVWGKGYGQLAPGACPPPAAWARAHAWQELSLHDLHLQELKVAELQHWSLVHGSRRLPTSWHFESL